MYYFFTITRQYDGTVSYYTNGINIGVDSNWIRVNGDLGGTVDSAGSILGGHASRISVDVAIFFGWGAQP